MSTAAEPCARRRAARNPNSFIKRDIRDFVRTSPLNRLTAFGTAIFDDPLIGFADGDDPIFMKYKEVIAPEHLTPREVMARHLAAEGKEPAANGRLSVISVVLPISRETSRSNAVLTDGPSLRWNNTRWQGEAFAHELSRHLVSLLGEMGHHAVAPQLEPFYRISRTPTGFFANWSERHAAYATGLGTFSLNEGFITKRGIAHRIAGVVTDMELQPTPRLYANHLANCRFYARGTCGKCVARCPIGAISEKGHDKLKCWHMLNDVQRPWLEGAHGPGYIGTYAGCGLCQTGVPCEHRIPVGKSRRLAGSAKP